MKNNYNFGVVKLHLKFNQRTISTPHKFQTCFPSQNLILFQPNLSHMKGMLVFMKVTTGIDIIDVERIKEVILEMGDSFLNKIYTDKEIEYCNKSEKMKYQHFAARFAAKEAVFKAISKYINGREDALWKNIEIINLEGGKPEINVDKLIENIEKTANNIVLKDLDISISHLKDYAVASVVAVWEDDSHSSL